MTTLPQTTAARLPQPAGPNFPSTGPSGALATQMTSADILRVLRSNLWLLIIALVLSGIGGYLLNTWLARHYPRYTATGLLEIQTNIIRGVVQDKIIDMPEKKLLAEQRTQAELLTNEALFSRVLQRQGKLRETRWFAQFRKPGASGEVFDTTAAKEHLQGNFHATPVSDSKLIAVTFRYSIPEDCRVVIEEIVGEHLDRQRIDATSHVTDQTKALRDASLKLGAEIQRHTSEARTLQEQLATAGTPGVGVPSSKESELRVLIEAQIKAASAAADTEALAAYVRGVIETGDGRLNEVEKAIENDGTVLSLNRELLTAEINRDQMIQQYGPSHREVTRLSLLADLTRQKLEDRRAELRARYRDQYVHLVEGEARQKRAEADSLNDKVVALKKELSTLSRQMGLYVMHRDEEKRLREQQQAIENRIRDIESTVNVASQSPIDWAAFGRPEIPEIRSFPKLKFVLPATMFLGLALALGIAFLREIMDDTVRSPRDIAHVGNVSLLGIISDETDDPQAARARIAIFDAPQSLTAEQYRMTRNRLQHAASLDTCRTLLVTGPAPLDGKTTVAANLAAGLALSGRRILLVDANFRRPQVHQLFAIANDRGFSDVLAGSAPLDDAAHASRVPNLSVLPGGRKPANATELFESQLLSDFIETALENYDHVIFDSAPLLLAAETQALAPRVDGVVSVILAHTETRAVLQQLRDALRQIHAQHIGVVLNAVRAHGGAYDRRTVKTYYGYQNEA